MKKALLLAVALTFVGGSAMASSWGSFGSYSDGYKREYSRFSGYTRRERGERKIAFVRNLREKLELDFCGCGDYWLKDCDHNGGGGPGETPSEVPLPAAGFLLLGAMGGIATLKRRKK